jgi:hypothetical protein
MLNEHLREAIPKVRTTDAALDSAGLGCSVPRSDAVHVFTPTTGQEKTMDITRQASAIPTDIVVSVPVDNSTTSTSPAMPPKPPAAMPSLDQKISSTTPKKRTRLVVRELIEKPNQTSFYKSKVDDLLEILHNLDGHIDSEVGLAFQREWQEVGRRVNVIIEELEEFEKTNASSRG